MIINNNTLKKLLQEKDELVKEGRALTGEIEKLENQLQQQHPQCYLYLS